MVCGLVCASLCVCWCGRFVFLKRVCLVCVVLCDGVQLVFVMCLWFVCVCVRAMYVCVACD